jgi:predicted AlkP superfamily phosphohydrolase/phosphomutase/tetratricopeptide (TPR) repeat protein
MTPRKVLLVGWDAADWKVIHPLMDAGKMPNVQRLVENGAMGQIATLHPPLSPMLWTSIATGKRPFRHGIHGFSEPTPDGRGIQPVTNLSRRVKALWNILNQNDLRSVVIGWWPSHPAEPINGVMVSDHYHRATRPFDEGWPLLKNAVHPPELAETLAELRMHPDLLTPEMVEPFIPLAREIDQDKDRRLAGLMRTLCECVSMHSAATWLLENQKWDFFSVYYDAIDHFCHGFMRYHPPRQSWISERDFEIYGNVVNMAYQFHDQMLGTLLQKAGEDVTVILMSDHGFHPDHLRPSSIPDIPAGPAIEHRDFGILAMRGQGIRKDELLHGASVLDIAPTVLTMYGLPIGEDMDGKVLSQAFVEPPEVQSIPSWEDVPGNDGRHAAHTRLDPVAAREALEQMIALGYIDAPDENREIAVEKTVQELRYNLGESYQDDARHPEAREIFRELRVKDRDEQRFAVRLFMSCQALGLTAEMREIVDDLDVRRRALFEEATKKVTELRKAAFELANHADDDAKRDPEALLNDAQKAELKHWKNLARYQPPVIDYLKAQVFTAEKRYAEALASLEKVTSAHMLRPGLFLQTADLYLRLRRWRDAEEVYRKALAIDPDNAHAHLGICRMELRRRKYPAAAQAALDSLQRIYHNPLAHYLLGIALVGMKESERSAAAFRAAISFNPNFPEAHVRLAAVLEKRLGDAEGAREHRRLAQKMRRQRSAERIPLVKSEREENVITPPPTCSGDLTQGDLPPIGESLIIVTGLPRSGTSMLMQMLAAGGVSIQSDGARIADEDNPRGYLEYEPVKNLLKDASWLGDARGKAIKIVAPLLSALPADLPCRVIFVERDLNEVLDSQEKMLVRRKQEIASTPERRQMLKDEYARTVARVKSGLARRPGTAILYVNYRDAVRDPSEVARRMNEFLDGGLDTEKMAKPVDPALHRNRHKTSGSSQPAY